MASHAPSERRKTSTDHIYPTSRGGSRNDINEREVRDNWHQALHLLFENMTPHERVIKLLEWDSQVIQQPTAMEIIAITRQAVADQKFYRPGVHRNIRE